MEFDGIEMTQSMGFRESLSLVSDRTNSPKKMHKYKCYECGGNQSKTSSCSTCRGRRSVGDSNPMVQLFKEVMMRKLAPNNKSSGSLQLPRQTLKHQFSQIKQESELADDRLVSCDNCFTEGELPEYSYCPQCAHFYLCLDCSRKGVEHEHPMTKYCLSQIQSQEDEEEKEEEEEKKHVIAKEEEDGKKCDNCKFAIQNCSMYFLCITCAYNGIDYKICEECGEKKKNFHNPEHELKPTLYRIEKKKMQRYSSISNNWILDKDGMTSQYMNSDEDEKQSRPSLFQREEQNEKSLQMPGRYESTIQVDIDENQSSYSDNFFDSRIRKTQIEEEKKQKLEEQEEEGDYCCDYCQRTIKNIRYHCQECEDFDLCERCYNSKRENHTHSEFSKHSSEEEEKKMQERQSINKKMFQSVVSSILDMHKTRNSKIKQ